MASRDTKRIKLEPITPVGPFKVTAPSLMPMEQLEVMAKAIFEHGMPEDFKEKKTFVQLFAAHYPMETIRLIDANPSIEGFKFKSIIKNYMLASGSDDESITYFDKHLQVYDPHNRAYTPIDPKLHAKLIEIEAPFVWARSMFITKPPQTIPKHQLKDYCKKHANFYSFDLRGIIDINEWIRYASDEIVDTIKPEEIDELTDETVLFLQNPDLKVARLCEYRRETSNKLLARAHKLLGFGVDQRDEDPFWKDKQGYPVILVTKENYENLGRLHFLQSIAFEGDIHPAAFNTFGSERIRFNKTNIPSIREMLPKMHLYKFAFERFLKHHNAL